MMCDMFTYLQFLFYFISLAKMNARRRPSMDSVSEDDSSPDSKRRVRMINRH